MVSFEYIDFWPKILLFFDPPSLKFHNQTDITGPSTWVDYSSTLKGCVTSDKKLRLLLLSFEKDLYDQETYVIIHLGLHSKHFLINTHPIYLLLTFINLVNVTDR